MKRGMAPLAATFLLIGFSVLLGAVVMSWGQEYVEARAQFVMGASAAPGECADIDLDTVKLRGASLACTQGNELKLVLENKGPSVIEAVQLRVIADSNVDVVQNTLKGPLFMGQAATILYPLQGPPAQVRLTPWLIKDRPSELCFDKEIVYEGPFPSC